MQKILQMYKKTFTCRWEQEAYKMCAIYDGGEVLTRDCLNWSRERGQAWVRKFWVVGEKRKSRRREASNLFKPLLSLSQPGGEKEKPQTFSSPCSCPSFLSQPAIQAWDVCQQVFWADQYVGCGGEQEHLEIAGKKILSWLENLRARFMGWTIC